MRQQDQDLAISIGFSAGAIVAVAVTLLFNWLGAPLYAIAAGLLVFASAVSLWWDFRVFARKWSEDAAREEGG